MIPPQAPSHSASRVRYRGKNYSPAGTAGVLFVQAAAGARSKGGLAEAPEKLREDRNLESHPAVPPALPSNAAPSGDTEAHAGQPEVMVYGRGAARRLAPPQESPSERTAATPLCPGEQKVVGRGCTCATSSEDGAHGLCARHRSRHPRPERTR